MFWGIRPKRLSYRIVLGDQVYLSLFLSVSLCYFWLSFLRKLILLQKILVFPPLVQAIGTGLERRWGSVCSWTTLTHPTPLPATFPSKVQNLAKNTLLIHLQKSLFFAAELIFRAKNLGTTKWNQTKQTKVYMYSYNAKSALKRTDPGTDAANKNMRFPSSLCCAVWSMTRGHVKQFPSCLFKTSTMTMNWHATNTALPINRGRSRSTLKLLGEWLELPWIVLRRVWHFTDFFINITVRTTRKQKPQLSIIRMVAFFFEIADI